MKAALTKKREDAPPAEGERVAYPSFNDLAHAVANGDESAVQLSESNAIGPTVVIGGDEHRVEAMHLAQSADRTVYVLVVVPAANTAPIEESAGGSAFLSLTPREREIAELLSDRRTNDEIAETLGISHHTARNHVQQILGKLGVNSRREVGQAVRRTSR